MNETLLWLIYIVACSVVVVGAIALRRKFNIKDADIKVSNMALTVVAILATKFSFKGKTELLQVVEHIQKAIDIVLKLNDVLTTEERIDLVFKEAKSLCVESGIVVDSFLEKVLLDAAKTFANLLDGEAE